MLTAHGSRLRPFTLLWAASTVSALGDGVRWIALPLLAASASGDPRTISLVTVAEQLPWLLFALVAGALADRLDRRRTLWAVDAARAVLMTGFAVLVATGAAALPVVLAVAFALSAAGTLHDSAAGAYVPALVEPARRSAANSRMQAGVLVADTLVGSPLGATLFAVAAALPFGLDAVSFVVAAALVWRIPARAAPVPATVSLVGSVPAEPEPAPVTVRPVPTVAGDPEHGDAPGRPASLRADVVEGVRFLLGHRLLRRLCWLGATVNLTTTAAVAILVLYATRVLHLDKLGYGLLVASFAVGGVGGALVVGRLARAVGERVTQLAALAAAAVSLAGAAAAQSPVLAGVGVCCFGAASSAWGVGSVSLRQALVPDRMLGRATSAHRLITLGAGPVGAVLAGLVAHRFDLRTPLWLSAVLLAAAAVAAPALLRRDDFPAVGHPPLRPSTGAR